MKKFLAVALILIMTIAFSATAFATVATDNWQGNPATETGAVSVDGNKIIASSETAGGAVSNQFRGDEITAEEKTYELIVDLSSDYQYGELFCTSLGFGTDADTYSTEFNVQTIKIENGFQLNAGVDPGKTITIAEPGIYTYQWTVSKTGEAVEAEFAVKELGDAGTSFTFANDTALNGSKCVRYLWVFGRQVEDDYKLDRDLVMYKEKPAIKGVSVVDGADGYTPVTVPQEGQVLYANVEMADGSTIGVYPGDDYLKYEWTYAENGQVIGTEAAYTVTSDNAGKTIAVKVTSPNGYVGEATWKADDVVGAEIKDEPTTPVDPEDPDVNDPGTTTDPDNTATDEEKAESDTPKTGDDNALLPWMAVLAVAGTGAIVFIKKKVNL